MKAPAAKQQPVAERRNEVERTICDRENRILGANGVIHGGKRLADEKLTRWAKPGRASRRKQGQHLRHGKLDLAGTPLLRAGKTSSGKTDAGEGNSPALAWIGESPSSNQNSTNIIGPVTQMHKPKQQTKTGKNRTASYKKDAQIWQGWQRKTHSTNKIKNQFFIENQQDYNESTEIAALSPAFDY
jgi:hypothetical protein